MRYGSRFIQKRLDFYSGTVRALYKNAWIFTPVLFALLKLTSLNQGFEPKIIGFLDWIWTGNPKPKKYPSPKNSKNP
jgi:hypothetical protein